MQQREKRPNIGIADWVKYYITMEANKDCGLTGDASSIKNIAHPATISTLVSFLIAHRLERRSP